MLLIDCKHGISCPDLGSERNSRGEFGTWWSVVVGHLSTRIECLLENWVGYRLEWTRKCDNIKRMADKFDGRRTHYKLQVISQLFLCELICWSRSHDYDVSFKKSFKRRLSMVSCTFELSKISTIMSSSALNCSWCHKQLVQSEYQNSYFYVR